MREGRTFDLRWLINGLCFYLKEQCRERRRHQASPPVEEPVTFSGLKEFTIDERTAWGWDERLQTPALGIDWVAFRMVVGVSLTSTR